MGDVREELNRLAERVMDLTTTPASMPEQDRISASLRALSARAAVPEGMSLLVDALEGAMIESLHGEGFDLWAKNRGKFRNRLPENVGAIVVKMRALLAAPQPAGEARIPKPDGDGHCDVCGLAWPNATETEEAHACPPGFANVVRPAPSAPADWNVDSSLETWFPYTAERLKALEAENEKLKAQQTSAPAPADLPADLAAAVADDDAAWRLARLAVECGAEDNATDGQPQTWTLGVAAFTELARRLSGVRQASDGKDGAE